jgi:hypothetical protein
VKMPVYLLELFFFENFKPGKELSFLVIWKYRILPLMHRDKNHRTSEQHHRISAIGSAIAY